MFLFLSFLTAFIALYCLGDAATYHPYGYSYDYTLPVVTLLIFSIVSIIREIKKFTEDTYGDNWYSNSNCNYYNGGSHYYSQDNHNEWLDKYGSRSASSTVVETFTPDNKKKEKEKRPMVLHMPSRQEARDIIKEKEKSLAWRTKRGMASFFGIDITAKYYEPRYVEEEYHDIKEDHKRFIPKQNNVAKQVYVSEYEKQQYNDVVKHIGRSCDIAFGDEKFVEIEDNNDENPGTSESNTIVNNN